MKVDDKFKSFEEFSAKLNVYKKDNLVEFWVRDNRTLKAARKRVPELVSKAAPILKYYYIKFCCIHGGQKLKSKEKKSKRQTR